MTDGEPSRPRAAPAAAAIPGTGPKLDVFLSGTVFMDVIFSDLPGLPEPGTEIFAGGLGSAPGGCANIAMALRRLGLNVGLAAAFGDDLFGGYLRQVLAAEGIDLGSSQQIPGWPTPLTVSLSHGGDRSMITYQRPLPAGATAVAIVPPAARACFVHLGTDLPDWALALRQSGATLFADVSWDASGAWPSAVLDRLALVDVFLLNAAEAMAYTRTASAAAALEVLAPHVPVCVVKDGGRGATGACAGTGERAFAPAIPVRLVDPTGAGGVFDAGFIYATLAGWPLAQRIGFANLCAGLSVRHHSGSLGAPGWDEIARWWRSPDLAPGVRADYGFIAGRRPAGEHTAESSCPNAPGPVARAPGRAVARAGPTPGSRPIPTSSPSAQDHPPGGE